MAKNQEISPKNLSGLQFDQIRAHIEATVRLNGTKLMIEDRTFDILRSQGRSRDYTFELMCTVYVKHIS